MKIFQYMALAGVALCPCAHGGCAGSPSEAEAIEASDLDIAGHLDGAAIMKETLADAFTAAGVSPMAPLATGSTTAATSLGSSQQFAAIMQAAPGGFRDRIIAYTEGSFAAKTGTSLAAVAVTTSAAQQLFCPVSGSCATSIGGVTPSLLVVPDVPDAVDTVLSDLCGARTLCPNVVKVADGPSAQQWNGTSWAAYAVTGPGKACASGDNLATCEHKLAAQTGTLVYGDTRIQVGAGVTMLTLDTYPIGDASYPRQRPIHLADDTPTDSRETAFFLWFDGDGTQQHPDHYTTFATKVATRGLISVVAPIAFP